MRARDEAAAAAARGDKVWAAYWNHIADVAEETPLPRRARQPKLAALLRRNKTARNSAPTP